VQALTNTIADGYVPARKSLRMALPEAEGALPPKVHCWLRRDRTYLDLSGCERLRELTEERWDAMGDAGVQPPTGNKFLAGVDLRYRIPFRRSQPEVRITTVAVPGGANDIQAVSMNGNGLMDVTDLGLL
jgi:hypothetical protein